ncbi:MULTISPECIES: alpha/beta fold hydrolase [unclassified Streptomyces]|uniref:alpha/beta fold hydrolase n=1 Tax=unclassified Streptomyces TaxID=2593676 RepID=UPI0036E6E427
MRINERDQVSEKLDANGGFLSYDVRGEGPLVVLAHGMGENRAGYGEVAERLAAGGYRVARLDLRGHGESSADWASYTRTEVAGDILALIRHLGGPAVIVGHSFSGGAATIAAVQEPDLVSAIVEIGPFTRAQKISAGALFRQPRYRKGAMLLMGATVLRSLPRWKRYIDHAFPGQRPEGFDAYTAGIEADLSRPGRMAVLSKFGMAAPKDAGAALGDVRRPALVLMGTLDPDWPDPRKEGEGIVAAMPAGVGHLSMIEGAGHYAHVQYPAEVAAAIMDFVRSETRA